MGKGRRERGHVDLKLSGWLNEGMLCYEKRWGTEMQSGF